MTRQEADEVIEKCAETAERTVCRALCRHESCAMGREAGGDIRRLKGTLGVESARDVLKRHGFTDRDGELP